MMVTNLNATITSRVWLREPRINKTKTKVISRQPLPSLSILMLAECTEIESRAGYFASDRMISKLNVIFIQKY